MWFWDKSHLIAMMFWNMVCSDVLYNWRSSPLLTEKSYWFVLRRYVSAAVQMGTLQCGTFTTRHWYGSSRVTQMVHHALTFLQMEPSYGLVGWTILSGLGTSGKAGNYSSMTSHHRSSLWAIVPLESGLLLAWRTPMLKFCMRPNLTNISCTFMNPVFSLFASLHVESGLSQLERTIF